MADKPDYYEVLGVDRDADQAAIKKAFRRLAREHHPDVNRDDPDAEERMKLIGEAYAVLSDADKRARYDRFGHTEDNGGFSGGDFDAGVFGEFADLFSSFFGGGGFGNTNQRRRGGPQAGDSLVVAVDLELEDVVNGCEKEIHYRRLNTCPGCFGTGAAEGSQPVSCTTCGGRGQVAQQRMSLFGITTVVTACPDCHGEGQVISNPCRRCQGQGRVQDRVTRTVRIPAGVDDGMRVKVPGGGNTGSAGGPDGDLYLQVRVRQHAKFQRDGMHLLSELPISFAQAALGDTVTVPGLVDEHALVIPAGTQTGHTFRVAGAGLPSARSGTFRGDLYVRVRIQTPTDLNEEQKELLYRFAQASGEKDLQPEEKGWFESLMERLGLR